MNILLLASHSIAEYDDIRMLSDLGYDVFCPGGYADPRNPIETLRPALDLPYHADLDALCTVQREKHGTETLIDGWAKAIDWAKADLHPSLIDWADVIICHHFPVQWLALQWPRIKHKRVVWRTCGQSNPDIERWMAPLHKQGLQIVRYSPKEQPAFEKAGSFAGQDAMIRFGKYPADWFGWTGSDPVVGNVTQAMVDRPDHCNLGFYLEATKGLPAKPAGPKSDLLPGGIGGLDYDAMREYLRRIRVYLYTGTQPASYTLGLIEAMMTGTPVVSIGPGQMWAPDLFEGAEITVGKGGIQGETRNSLGHCLESLETAQIVGEIQRDRAISMFGMGTVGPQWTAFLGSVSKAVAA